MLSVALKSMTPRQRFHGAMDLKDVDRAPLFYQHLGAASHLQKATGIITKEGFERKLHDNGIPTDDCYPPLHRLACFRESRLRENIDYARANWGGDKSDDALFPVVSDIYERSVQLPHYVLLADRGKLDYIAQTIADIGH